jgi:hypothetical protein
LAALKLHAPSKASCHLSRWAKKGLIRGMRVGGSL